MESGLNLEAGGRNFTSTNQECPLTVIQQSPTPRLCTSSRACLPATLPEDDVRVPNRIIHIGCIVSISAPIEVPEGYTNTRRTSGSSEVGQPISASPAHATMTCQER